MSSFYEGDCEECGEYSADRDCCYNISTGEEKYLCPTCLAELNKENDGEKE